MVKRTARMPGHRVGGYDGKAIHMIDELTDRDIVWLHLLACGVKQPELYPRSYQTAKNRLGCIRMFFGARTTTQAVAMAFSWGIIR